MCVFLVFFVLDTPVIYLNIFHLNLQMMRKMGGMNDGGDLNYVSKEKLSLLI